MGNLDLWFALVARTYIIRSLGSVVRANNLGTLSVMVGGTVGLPMLYHIRLGPKKFFKKKKGGIG